MKKFLVILNVVLMFSAGYSQNWVNELVMKNRGLISSPDSLVNLLSNEFQKVVGTTAPEFSYHDLKSDSIKTIKDYKGNIILVNLWSTDCSGCRLEMPHLSFLQDSLKDKGFIVLYLSPEPKDKLEKYFAENKISGMKGIVKPNDLERPYQIVAKPTSFVVDRDGKVCEAWIGTLRKDELINKLIPSFDTKSK